MLSWRHLTYSWQAGASPLRFPDFEAPQGARILLSGPSGCGKSTLLALLAGLLHPTQGQLNVAGQALGAGSPRPSDAWRGAHVGLVPQRLHLIEALTVRENLSMPFVAAGLAVDHDHIEASMAALGLSAQAGLKPAALSGGQAQRVAVARACMRQPKVVLADEPTAHLDDDHAHRALVWLDQAAQACGATLLVATHDARCRQHWPDALHCELSTPAKAEQA